MDCYAVVLASHPRRRVSLQTLNKLASKLMATAKTMNGMTEGGLAWACLLVSLKSKLESNVCAHPSNIGQTVERLHNQAADFSNATSLILDHAENSISQKAYQLPQRK